MRADLNYLPDLGPPPEESGIAVRGCSKANIAKAAEDLRNLVLQSSPEEAFRKPSKKGKKASLKVPKVSPRVSIIRQNVIGDFFSLVGRWKIQKIQVHRERRDPLLFSTQNASRKSLSKLSELAERFFS